ncbi:hypothetical protein Tco_0540165 [Tanacetum coccineum]
MEGGKLPSLLKMLRTSDKNMKERAWFAATMFRDLDLPILGKARHAKALQREKILRKSLSVMFTGLKHKSMRYLENQLRSGVCEAYIGICGNVNQLIKTQKRVSGYVNPKISRPCMQKFKDLCMVYSRAFTSIGSKTDLMRKIKKFGFTHNLCDEPRYADNGKMWRVASKLAAISYPPKDSRIMKAADVTFSTEISLVSENKRGVV